MKDQSQELLFDVIRRIEKLEIETQYLHKFRNLLLKDKDIKPKVQPFILKQILKTFEGQGLNQLKAKVKN